MKCIESCTGIAIIEWEREFFKEKSLNRTTILDYIEKNAQTLREYYCANLCPVTKFRRRYEHKR